MALKSKPLEDVRPDVPVDDVTREEQVRVNLIVPAPLRKAWKAAAVQADTTVTDMIIEAMKKHLEKTRK